MSSTEIPTEQLDRIQPIIETLRNSLRNLVKDLPFDQESALSFDPRGENE